ncbi:MAG: ABC transporter ATP-binding protein [Candidatus Hydrogenedentota bacterium]
MHIAIETEGLTKHFDAVRAVDGLDLAVERGSFYGFLGPNGAGKSTTMKMLTGILAPTAGSVRLLGRDLAREPLAIKQHIGVVPEELCLFENLTAREYLTFVGRMYRMNRDDVRRRSDELLALFGLEGQEATLTLEFSHGMKKKLSLAAALIHDPELLFLDEPFEGIDAITSRVIRRVLERVVQRGATIFLTSHILEVVEKLCSHVGIIHRGRLAVQGPLGELTGGEGLERVFVDTVGAEDQAAIGLSWLEDSA